MTRAFENTQGSLGSRNYIPLFLTFPKHDSLPFFIRTNLTSWISDCVALPARLPFTKQVENSADFLDFLFPSQLIFYAFLFVREHWHQQGGQERVGLQAYT
jgi:hypothetical protein